MAQPTPSDVHVNRPLTNVMVAYMQDQNEFVSDKVFPKVPVQKQSDRYFVMTKDQWFRAEAQVRAPGTESAGSGFTVDNTPTYFCPVVAVHKDIDDQVRANQDEPLELDAASARWVGRQLLLKREISFAQKYFKTGVWAGGDPTPATKWNATGSTPIVDIRKQIQAVQDQSGYRANGLLLSRSVWNVLQDHPDFLDRIKYVMAGGAKVSLALLASVLEIDNVYVSGALQNTANEGATAALSQIFGKHALVYYAASAPSIMEPSAGYTFAWTGYTGADQNGGRVKRFRMEPLASDRVEGEYAIDQKVVATDCAVFMQNVIT